MKCYWTWGKLSLSLIYIYVSVSVIPNQWKKLVLFSRDNSGLPHGFPFGILQKVPPRARTPTRTSSRSTAADLEKTHLWLIHINLHWSITLFPFGCHHKHPLGTIRVMVQKTWYPDGTPSLVPQVWSLDVCGCLCFASPQHGHIVMGNFMMNQRKFGGYPTYKAVFLRANEPISALTVEVS